MTITQRTAIAAIHAYQRWITRHTPRCTLTPSCSDYAINAIRQHGLTTGLTLTIARTGKPHP